MREREMSDGGEIGRKVACVTGGSGYIASWLVKLLLARGYTVRATLRTLDDPRKTEHLFALDGAKERLQLLEADLIEEGCFDSVVCGCDGVFHTASPVSFSVTDPQVELIDPAVRGTLNVLRSCAKAPSVKRVVITSSMASVVLNGKPLNPNVEVDESWFSDSKFCEDSKLWYMLSKTLAEEEAWKFAKEKGIDLVTLNPGCVIGPPLQPTLNLTCEGILDLIKKKEDLVEGNSPYVDVRDVAFAHIQAFEIPSASGRYCLVGTVTYYSQVINILHKLYPATIQLPKKFEAEIPILPPYKVSMQRAKSLGINFIPLEVSLKDTVESLKEKNFLSF